MTFEESCGGWCVYWPEKPLGKRLQGWYAQRLDMMSAVITCQRYLDEVARRKAKS